MNMIREMVKRIGTVGLAVIILVTQGPVTVFADELTGTGGSVVMDGIPVDEVSPSGQERADEPETTEDRTQDPEAVVDQSEDPQDPEVIVEEPEDPQEPEAEVEEPEDPQEPEAVVDQPEDPEEPEAAEDETEEPKEAEENEEPRTLDENDDKDPEAETTDGEIETEEDSSRDKKLGQDENIDDAEEDKSYPPFEETISIDDVKITVTADEGAFPEGALLSVEKVTKAREKEVEEAVENERPDGQNVAISYTYDIKVLNEKGEELQPANEQKVRVSFELPHAADENLNANVYHISETEDKDTEETDTDDLSADAQNETETETSEDAYTVEKLEADTDADEETITVETEGFSFYTVEFTYGDLQYVMEGDSSVRLATIVSSIGLKGDAGVVSVSNEELFSASRDGGEWIITAHKPFSSQEWMKISIDGVEYRVTVTDDSDIVLITSWSQMRDQADKSSNNNKTLRLDADIYANGKDRILIKNKTLTIDLNGHTMDRQRTKTDSDGHVIEIQDGAKVTIKDSSPSKTGLITGGYAKRGGGIHIGKGTTCIIEGGTIKNNKSSIDGGGIYIRGTLKMTGGTVTDNYADDTAGGIYCIDTGTFDIENARITNNRAKNDGGGFVVHLKSDASIKNSVISGNKTDKDDGGGIRMDEDDKTLNIVNTEISGNTANDTGGGIVVEGGRVKMTGGSVKGNTAKDGGGVYNDDGTIEFEGVEVSGNTSTEEGGAGVNNKNNATLKNCTIKNNVSHDRGGGVYAGDDITLEGCTFEGNTSTDDGGGVCFNDVNATVRNCTFKGNKTNCSGGAIHIEDGKINVIDTTITDQNSADDYGGGICIDDDADVYCSGTNVITNNKAKDGGGGMSVGYDTDIAGIKDTLIVKDNECEHGSDVYLRYINETKLFESIKIYERKYEWAWLTLTGRLNADSHIGIFTEQPFTYLSSDITEDYGKYHGDEDPARYFIAQDGYNVVISSENEAFISVSNWSSLQRQIDDAADGATITIDKNWQALPDDKNLRIPATKMVTIDLNGYTIDRNRLSKDAKDAGEVFTVYGTLIVTDSSVGGTGKICGGHGNCGGGVYVHKGGSFTLTGGNIEGNKAKNGGGIYNYLGNVFINGGNVSGNSAAADGGGVYNAKAQGSDTGTSTLTLSGGKITNNDAGYQAGGVYLADDSTLNVKEEAYVAGNNAATGKNILLFDDNCIDVTGSLVTGDTDGNNALLDFSVKQNRTVSSGGTVPDKQITRGLGSNSGMQAFTYNGREAAYSPSSTPVCVTDGELYLKGSRPDDDAFAISSWKNLYDILRNGSNEGKKFYIATDLKANKDHHEEIEVKINVEIDLNGRFVDRNRYDGSVFTVKGGKTLTIKDNGGTGTICGGVGDDDGGGFYVEDNATLVMTGGTIANNGADETGGGIYCSNGGTLKLEGVTISHNTAEWRGGGLRLHLKDDNSYIRNCIISNNTTEDSGENYGGGGISISARDKTFEISDTVISDNTATNGGGIFAYDGSKLVLTGVTISGNTTTKYGGAGINNTDSTITLDGCTIRDNTSETTGAGIWASGGSTTTITGSTITANQAKTSGGGMHTFGTTIIKDGTKISGNNATDSAGGVLAETDLQISGKVEIVENLDGQNVCLKNNKKLVTGILDPASSIGVGIINSQNGNKGVFTSGFAANNPSVDPAVIFYSDDGYSVFKTEDGNEAEIRLEINDGGDFIDWTSQITDTSRLTPKNWMSGISGDRYLNEINLPCTHDSSMNSVTASRTSSIGALMGYSENAKTQIRYINEQMNEGVRRFDIRLTYYDSRGQFDYPNLYNNHGKDKVGGTFWALDPDGNAQTLEKILGWVKEFLKEHPTEVIILDLQPEPPGIYIDKEDIADAEDTTYNLAKRIIGNNINGETNPSTGKPYVYWRNGEWETFTSFPQLKECRGQVIFKCDKNNYIGGINDTTISPVTKSKGPSGGSTGCTVGEKITSVRKFLQPGIAPDENIIDIPRDVTSHLDRFYSASVLAAPVGAMGIPSCTPLEAAEKIHKALFYNKGFFDQKGQYVGWIRQDGVNAQLNRYIWASNFPTDLNYVSVIVKSGIEGVPDQTYRLLKGTQFKIPGDIYNNDQQQLYYWKATVPSGSETAREAKCYPQTTYTVMADEVTFTADWTGSDPTDTQTPISAVWFDDDYSGRPDSLTVTYVKESDGNDETVVISKDDAWEASITDVSQINSVTYTEESGTKTIPLMENGQTVPGEYCYKAEKNDQGSWIISLYRTEETPQVPTYLYGTIVWDDYDNADGKRPSGVKLNLKDGSDTTIASQSLIPEENNWSWSFKLDNDPTGTYSVEQEDLTGDDLQEGTGLAYYTVTEENNENNWVITNHLASHTHNSTNLKHVSGEDESCIKDGNKEYWYCDSCGKCFWDENGNSEITDAEKDTIIIPATGHQLERHAAQNPTCREDGNTEYWQCENCGAYFSDENAEHKVNPDKIQSKGGIIIHSTGHSWRRPTYTWSEDMTAVTAESVCDNDHSHVQEDTAKVTSKTEEPSCETSGETVYTATFKNGIFDDQEKTEVIPALGHSFGEWVVIEKPEKLKQRTCKRCGKAETIGIKQYAVDVIVDGHGTATASPKAAEEKKTIKLSATADKGYEFKGWTSYDGVKFADAASASTTFTMPAKDVTVRASFEKAAESPVETEKTYTISVKTVGNGTATASKARAKAGKKITIKAASMAGYKFRKWKVTEGVKLKDEKKASTSFVMPAKNVTVKAIFEKIYEVPQPEIEPVDDDKIMFAWWKVNEAEGYDIFMSRCNHGGKKTTPKLVKTIKGNKTFSWEAKGLKTSKSYKAYVKAYVIKDGKKKYVSKSPLVHAYTSGGNKTYTNAKSIKIDTSDGKIKKNKLTLKVKDTYKIKAGVVKADKKKKLMSDSHVKTLRYRSSDPGVATVNSSGKITARKKGKCKIYVYAHNGVNKTIKVTVK